MEQAHQIASQKASKASTKGKRQFDKKARAKGTNVPVYEVKRESGLGTPRVLHRNLLLPCPYLCDESENDQDREVKKTMQPALRNENPILRENESEEQNVDNVQEVDLLDDNNVDGNQGIDAPPDDNREQTEVPVQQTERPQRLRRPPERLEYYEPGQPGYVQPIAVCTMCAQRCQSQLPYAPVTCWPLPSDRK
ncbi:Hypothetical predicted protein [Paramuricea clavata]|uniref:Uncharacterized protein n=1 Tax=Paramuricea clavata TaxID=317549 RepID=A0A6S7JIY3_PARCT|nr:Hypothetical predicted protein [Paramuricea clavata]